MKLLSLCKNLTTCASSLRVDAFFKSMEKFGLKKLKTFLVRALWFGPAALTVGPDGNQAPGTALQQSTYIYKPINWSCIFYVNPVWLGAQVRLFALCYCVVVHGLDGRPYGLSHSSEWVSLHGPGCLPLIGRSSPRSWSASSGRDAEALPICLDVFSCICYLFTTFDVGYNLLLFCWADFVY